MSRTARQSSKKCAICHKIGLRRHEFGGAPTNGLDGRHSGSVAGFNYSEATKILPSSGTSRLSRITSRTQKRKFPAQKWYSLASRTNRKQRICGHTSSSSMLGATKEVSNSIPAAKKKDSRHVLLCASTTKTPTSPASINHANYLRYVERGRTNYLASSAPIVAG